MAGIVKTVVRLGVITALAGGAVVVIAGPDRAMALFGQARDRVHKLIDRGINDPVALRSQLRSLEEEYPKKIADVRGDLAELNEQIAQLGREQEISKRVVALTDQDLEQMKGVLAKAEDARATGGAAIVKVRFGDQSMKLDDGYAKANRVSQLRTAYATRSADIDRDLGYLAQQKSRLSTLLDQLETERAEFQTQLWQLDRQVDAIARNDRMIELMEKRQETINEHSRYRVASLDQLTARFADIRAKQESKLEMLGQATDIKNYEDAAKYQLDTESSRGRTGFLAPRAREIEVSPSVIEIGPEDVGPSKDTSDQVATRGG